jgi:8-oxo-dGTP diphosphatase/2-hydroxy-dATP diphosphatase
VNDPSHLPLATLCFVVRDGEVLLGWKKRGLGAHLWNGFGGKVEAGETIEEAARRETVEESGIETLDIENVGVLRFYFDSGEWDQEVHVFLSRRWQGEPRETDEMAPRWYGFASIPYGDMWIDDQHWLPLVLEGQRVFGEFRFADEKTLTEFTIGPLLAHEAKAAHPDPGSPEAPLSLSKGRAEGSKAGT